MGNPRGSGIDEYERNDLIAIGSSAGYRGVVPLDGRSRAGDLQRADDVGCRSLDQDKCHHVRPVRGQWQVRNIGCPVGGHARHIEDGSGQPIH